VEHGDQVQGPAQAPVRCGPGGHAPSPRAQSGQVSCVYEPIRFMKIKLASSQSQRGRYSALFIVSQCSIYLG
jgi:hypothetical protein